MYSPGNCSTRVRDFAVNDSKDLSIVDERTKKIVGKGTRSANLLILRGIQFLLRLKITRNIEDNEKKIITHEKLENILKKKLKRIKACEKPRETRLMLKQFLIAPHMT